jgi:hypothetical protein
MAAPPPAPPPGPPPGSDPVLALYKSEYELTSARYENIFKAVWQNFSYMTAISGAVLAFGGDRLQLHFLWFIVCLPLVFWYLATFEPLNHYGDMASDRLAAIETELNRLYGVVMEHYAKFAGRKTAGGLFGLMRVRNVVRLFFLPLCLVFIYHASITACALFTGTPLIRDTQAQVKFVSISAEELEKLLAKKGIRPPEETPSPGAVAPKDKN